MHRRDGRCVLLRCEREVYLTVIASMEITYVKNDGTLTYDGMSLFQDIIDATGGGGGGGATLADGDYGDVTVSGAGSVITIDAGAVGVTKLGASVTLDAIANPVAAMDFAQQQSQRFVIENRTSDPGAPVSGEVWLRIDL